VRAEVVLVVMMKVAFWADYVKPFSIAPIADLVYDIS
jgi:hypothetical protein